MRQISIKRQKGKISELMVYQMLLQRVVSDWVSDLLGNDGADLVSLPNLVKLQHIWMVLSVQKKHN